MLSVLRRLGILLRNKVVLTAEKKGDPIIIGGLRDSKLVFLNLSA